jgi:dTDP-4-dehydrorhamnose reductase
MRVIIFGATGLLGKTLVGEWTGDEVFALGSKDADICMKQQVHDAVSRICPDWIVLAAAYTDVDGCESNADLAFAVNSQGASNVAQVAKDCGAKLLFVSTDYIFDGKKTEPYETTDPPAPHSVYGKSKADAEVQLLEILPEVCIMRTSWVYGVGGKCFPDTILKLAATRPEIDVVNDQRGCPTYTVDLSRAIIHLCRSNAKGIVHVTNSGDCTWYDFALEIIAARELPTLVRPTTSDKFVRPAERPKYSVLSTRSAQKYGLAMPGWRDALHRYLSERM